MAVLVQVGDQVLAAPAQLLDPAAEQGRLDLRRSYGRGPQGVQHLRVHDRAAGHAIGQLAADGLDLGKLGHAISVRTRVSVTG